MYYRLKSEIIYRGYNMKEFCVKCDIPYVTWLRKMKEQTFTLDEAVRIKKCLQTDILLEDLFKWEDPKTK